VTRGRLNAVAPGVLVQTLDQLTGRRFLIDTGASFSIFPHSSQQADRGQRLSGPDGQPIQCWGEKQLQVQFSGRRFTWKFLLADVQFAIIGVDFLRHFQLLVDPAGGCLIDKQSRDTIPAISAVSSPATEASLGGDSSHSLTGRQVESSPATGASLGGGSNRRQTGRQVESSSEPGWCAAVGPPFAALLAKFPAVVNPSKKLPPAAKHNVEHHIRTANGPPISSKFRRLDAAKLAAAKAEFDQLERDGIIRRSDSPWSSPLHMVMKPDGTWRPCGDYRRLNLVTIPDAYPLPNMLDFAQRMAGCKIFSKIDLRKGYHQIPMHQADIPKTAIITPFGLYDFL